MKIKPFFIIKIILILFIFIYINFSDINYKTNVISAILTLILSIILLYKSRNNLLVTLITFLIFYCNYSIVMGEYIIGGHLGVPIYEVKNLHNYGVGIRILLLFMSIITIFYKGQNLNLSEFKLIPKDNIIIFTSISFTLVYILIFGIKRGNLVSYSVMITPIYEYSNILFLFAYYFSGKSVIRKSILCLLILMFILQDFYYGGRITSLQLMILLVLTLFIEELTFKKIISYGIVGIFINSLVGSYRSNYTLQQVNLLDVFRNIINNYFVFDTPVYGYYASATHIAASEIAGWDIRIDSFLAFIKAIFIGSRDIKSNLTRFVSINYFNNIGGGLIPTHFYFWMGWLGVIVIALIVVSIINNLGHEKNDYQKLLSIAIVFSAPRWYLYSPLNLFRGPFFLLTLVYIFLIALNTIILKLFSKYDIVAITQPLRSISKSNN